MRRSARVLRVLHDNRKRSGRGLFVCTILRRVIVCSTYYTSVKTYAADRKTSSITPRNYWHFNSSRTSEVCGCERCGCFARKRLWPFGPNRFYIDVQQTILSKPGLQLGEYTPIGILKLIHET